MEPSEENREPSSSMYVRKDVPEETHKPFAEPHQVEEPHRVEENHPAEEPNHMNPLLKENSSQNQQNAFYNSERIHEERENEFNFNEGNGDSHCEPASSKYNEIRRDSEIEEPHQNDEPMGYGHNEPLNQFNDEHRGYQNQFSEEPHQEYNNRDYREEPRDHHEEDKYPAEPSQEHGLNNYYGSERRESLDQNRDYDHSGRPFTSPQKDYEIPSRPYNDSLNKPSLYNDIHQKGGIYSDDAMSPEIQQPADKPKPSMQDFVGVAKKAIVNTITKVEEKFSPGFKSKLHTESFAYKNDILYGKLDVELAQKVFRSKLVKDLEEELEKKNISLKLVFGDGITRWTGTNKEAIELYLKKFKTVDQYPTLEQLKLIVDFHSECSSITVKGIQEYVIGSQASMLERQYFVEWITTVYGLNLQSIKTSSIENSEDLEESQIQVRLLALLCLFYDVHPQELMELQLVSVVYLKPNFCFKSHCGDFLLVLPETYSGLVSKLIKKCKKSDYKSCIQEIGADSFRSFSYHGLNRLFSSIE